MSWIAELEHDVLELRGPALHPDVTRSAHGSLRYAFRVGRACGGHQAVYHAGELDGFSGWLAYYPDRDVTVAIVTNTVAKDVIGPLMQDVSRAIRS